MRKKKLMKKQRDMQVLRSIRRLFSFVVGMLLFTSCESERLDDIFATADKIGALRYEPHDDDGSKAYGEYWNEKVAAVQEDAKNGYPSKWTSSGGRLAGTVTTMTIGRPDVSKMGPRLRACEEKWSPLLERNYDIGKQRIQAIGNLHGLLLRRKAELTDEKFDNLCSNVVRRARLTPREAKLLLTWK